MVAAVLFTGCAQDEKVINVVDSNSKRYKSLEKTKHIETKSSYIIVQKLSENSYILKINSKNREIEINLVECSNAHIEKDGTNSLGLPNWLNSYRVTTYSKKRECRLSSGDRFTF
jgi:hypothetical protein